MGSGVSARMKAVLTHKQRLYGHAPCNVLLAQ
jgi:hypothetical protein